MQTFGIILFIVGVLSAVLYFLDMNFMFLSWINQWGPDKAWMIRVGIIFVGIILYFLGKRTERA